MDEFKRSCSNAEQYPKNLLANNAPVYTRRAIEDQLNQHSKQLFCDEAPASSKQRPSLSFLEGSAAGTKSQYLSTVCLKLIWWIGYKVSNVSTLKALHDHLAAHGQDYKTRYVSVNAISNV